MINTGIENAESQEGIDFCVNSCPYNYCIVFEEHRKRADKFRNIIVAKALRKLGLSVDDIAEKLKKSTRTINKYLETED